MSTAKVQTHLREYYVLIYQYQRYSVTATLIWGEFWLQGVPSPREHAYTFVYIQFSACVTIFLYFVNFWRSFLLPLKVFLSIGVWSTGARILLHFTEKHVSTTHDLFIGGRTEGDIRWPVCRRVWYCVDTGIHWSGWRWRSWISPTSPIGRVIAWPVSLVLNLLTPSGLKMYKHCLKQRSTKSRLIHTILAWSFVKGSNICWAVSLLGGVHKLAATNNDDKNKEACDEYPPTAMFCFVHVLSLT